MHCWLFISYTGNIPLSVLSLTSCGIYTNKATWLLSLLLLILQSILHIPLCLQLKCPLKNKTNIINTPQKKSVPSKIVSLKNNSSLK